MDVVSLCPLRVASIPWQRAGGGWVLTVVVKATFELRLGESRLSSEQEYPNEYENHWDDDPDRSVYSPSDLVPFKPRADVIVVGHAFAPPREPARSLVARVVVGTVDKSIEVHGERSWGEGGALLEGPRFMRVPLRYERAAGGPDTQNPVGHRAEVWSDAASGAPIPNLQPANVRVQKPGDRFAPVGFGPIGERWPERAQKLGRLALKWVQDNYTAPMPDDVDPAFFNAAPADQQCDRISPSGQIVLEHLSSKHPRLITGLPGLAPRAFAERGGPFEEVMLACDTLWIDTDRSICTATWRGQINVSHPSERGRVAVLLEEPGRRLTREEIEARLREGTSEREPQPSEADIDGELGGTVADDEQLSSETLKLTLAEAQRRLMRKPTNHPDLPFVSAVAVKESAATITRPPQRTATRPGEALPFVSPLTPLNPPSQLAGSAPPPSTTMPPVRRPETLTGDEGLPRLTPDSAIPFMRGPDSMPRLPVPPAPPPPPSIPSMGPLPVAPPVGPPPIAVPAAITAPPVAPPVGPPPIAAPPMVPAPAMAPIASAWAPQITDNPSPMIPPAGLTIGAASLMGGAASPKQPAPPPLVTPSGPPPAAPTMSSPPSSASVLAMSNAAVRPWKPEPVGEPAARPMVPAPSPSRSSMGSPAGVSAPDVVELLWFDTAVLPRVRGEEQWREALKELEPPKPEIQYDDEDPIPDLPQDEKDRRDINGVLTSGEPTRAEGIDDLLERAIDDKGSFKPPLLLSSGDLTLPFDELETLKCTVTAVTPLAAGDKKVKETLDAIAELLKTPWLQGASGVAEGLTARLKEAFAQHAKLLPPSYLEAHTERMLLEQRHFQRRTLFGETWLRGLMMLPGATGPIPTYLPEPLAKKLPMFQRLKVRIVAELHLQQDQYESHPHALKVVALGRVVPLGRGRR